ncbi:MAG: hypothetical protein OEZ35_09195, partial [Candidatus Bathyarchaeota archaeon]|nr:hypothetical protein [Candidatus Bathyarchaeota archaeon]
LPSEKLSEDKLFSELKGNTLSVYWYFLTRRRNPIGVREIQRALHFSSSSTADYHLKKLIGLGLIDKDSFGNYKVKRVVKVGIISAFLFVGRFVFPKHLIYSIITSAMILLFLLSFAEMLSLIVFVALLPGILATVIFWYETLTVWKRKPSRATSSKN